jgi:hypothetical protein
MNEYYEIYEEAPNLTFNKFETLRLLLPMALHPPVGLDLLNDLSQLLS